MSMLLVVLLASLSQATPDDTERTGVIEFVRPPGMFLSHSIKVFVVEREGRIRYLDDIGRARRLVLEARPGTHEFVVIVQSDDAEGLSEGAPADPERRRRPNASVPVEAGKVTTVKVGAFTDFVRDFDRNPNGVLVRTPSNTPEGSHFVTRVDVDEPRERRR